MADERGDGQIELPSLMLGHLHMKDCKVGYHMYALTKDWKIAVFTAWDPISPTLAASYTPERLLATLQSLAGLTAEDVYWLGEAILIAAEDKKSDAEWKGKLQPILVALRNIPIVSKWEWDELWEQAKPHLR